jgi:predicted alpha/beta hydrolase
MPLQLSSSPGRPLTFEADDAVRLHGRWFTPSTPARGVVLIVPAMATASAFYSGFASWLAENGYATMTFDYRGYGDSATEPMSAVTSDLLRWAHDARDALAHVHAEAADLPITWIGHSFGGQALPFADHQVLSAAMNVSSGSGYWRMNSFPARLGAPLLWKVVAPATIALYGYYPGAKLRVLDDLPSAVTRQWASWCMHPDYLLSEFPEARQSFADVALPLRSLSFTDDKLMSDQSIARLEALYTGTRLTSARFSPAELGVKSIGHHGFFHRSRTELWHRLVLPFLTENS